MPRIFDNISLPLLPAIRDTLQISHRADFCVGYFNLRGWRRIDGLIDRWPGGEGACCRLLIGMQERPHDELRAAVSLTQTDGGIDQQRALRLKRQMAEQFREQLTLGMPTNDAETGLRCLSEQLRARKVVVKLFLRYHLHAKLYLLHRHDPNNPTIGFVGSSNLTVAGLSQQGELNVDVLDHDACEKMQAWFDARWDDKWCLDISEELAEIIDASWARPQQLVPTPYQIYLKIAYHLAREARAGLSEFRIPREFGDALFEYQAAAVKIAAHHLNKRGGVVIGDVVGLGKTLMATALARVFQDDHSTETLIICPKNLVRMWEDYIARYRLIARVVPLSRVVTELADLRRYRVVLIDESHNLRNREGKRYKAIRDYIGVNESRCILLSATPYNKSYLDLSAQLRLFVPEDLDLGIKPEKQILAIGETEFIRRHQCAPRTLAAFEKSEYPDDWRDLMRLYMVRRTRSFIQQNYAERDTASGRTFLTFADGQRSYFPTRVPLTIRFAFNERDANDPYARLYAPQVEGAINGLALPRYGLGNYVSASAKRVANAAEKAQLDGLSRAGQRLMGFCRTNLFKRLESGGPAFIQSLERHTLRNFIFLHALVHGLPLPLGTQDAALLDSVESDADADALYAPLFDDPELDVDEESGAATDNQAMRLRSVEEFQARASEVYAEYAGPYKRRFKWIRPALFDAKLKADLQWDAEALIGVLNACGTWQTTTDAKLAALVCLLTVDHPQQKVLVFTQFADTVDYLTRQLAARGVRSVEGATGDAEDPTALAWRFSPVSNGKRETIKPGQEIRVLVATDVLSEGQNLQDCAIIVNYDLPWAIIRLIQRAGRVDRIGQLADEIRCYSFLPADGIERIIQLRGKVRQRLKENAEVIGTDEAFFEDETDVRPLIDLYNEKAGILDGDADGEVDLASYAYQIWKNAIDADPSLKRTIEDMPDVVYSSRSYTPEGGLPEGVVLYVRTPDDTDALAWIDRQGQSVTQSQLAILQAAQCHPATPTRPRHDEHHDLVQRGLALIASEEGGGGGHLGRPSGARFRTYERLKAHAEKVKGTLFDVPALGRAIEEIYRYPLRQTATDTLNRQLKSGIDDHALVNLVLALRDEDRLCVIHEEERERDPRIICSLGLFADQGGQ